MEEIQASCVSRWYSCREGRIILLKKKQVLEMNTCSTLRSYALNYFQSYTSALSNSSSNPPKGREVNLYGTSRTRNDGVDQEKSDISVYGEVCTAVSNMFTALRFSSRNWPIAAIDDVSKDGVTYFARIMKGKLTFLSGTMYTFCSIPHVSQSSRTCMSKVNISVAINRRISWYAKLRIMISDALVKTCENTIELHTFFQCSSWLHRRKVVVSLSYPMHTDHQSNALE